MLGAWYSNSLRLASGFTSPTVVSCQWSVVSRLQLTTDEFQVELKNNREEPTKR